MIENSTLSTDLNCRVDVVDRAGGRHIMAWTPGQSLMEALRDNDLPILASCGGKAACATCHVFLKPAVIAQLGPRNQDEQELLEETEAYNAGTSRLACQVRHDPLLDRIAVQLAPEEE